MIEEGPAVLFSGILGHCQGWLVPRAMEQGPLSFGSWRMGKFAGRRREAQPMFCATRPGRNWQ